MGNIISLLGYSPCISRKIWIIGLFLVHVLFMLLSHQTVNILMDFPFLLHILFWGLWFCWQGHFFNQNRKRYIREPAEIAYRKAFYRDILPGAAIGVSQMIYPGWYGLWSAQSVYLSLPGLMIGTILMTGGILMVYSGIRIIGFDGAGFLYEYLENKYKMMQHNIYSIIRHPLFLGGVISSVGFALMIDNPDSIMMSAINVCTLPIYVYLEDRRLVQVFGATYEEYRQQVGAFVPDLRLLYVLHWKNLTGIGIRVQKVKSRTRR